MTPLLVRCADCGTDARIPATAAQLVPMVEAGRWVLLWSCPSCQHRHRHEDVASGLVMDLACAGARIVPVGHLARRLREHLDRDDAVALLTGSP